MAEAVELARLGRYKTCPNPAVGAVLVRDNAVVARGWHHNYGNAHAEIECLRDAASRNIPASGATMVVTLEPCRHYGKTPPCAQALVDAGIDTLVYGMADPNPEAGGGAEVLRQAGVKVIGPVLEDACRDLLSDFMIWQTTDRPWVILKLAASLDGRIATRTGHSRWITGKKAREHVHAIRAAIGEAGGAILIGGGTFRTDNPDLSARTENKPHQPLACIVTSRLPAPNAEFRLLQKRPNETAFFTSPAAAASTTAEALRKLGCRVYAIAPERDGSPGFSAMFSIIRQELGCYFVLCEGGGRLALSLLECGYVDEFHLFLAPVILGDNHAKPLFDGRNPISLEEALRMRLTGEKRFGADICLFLRPDNSAPPCSQAS